MSLSDLQPELIAQILEYVEEKAKFASVNTLWRDTVERVLFRTIKINSTTRQLDDLKRLLIGRRQRHLKNLTFEILLPEYDEEGYCEGRGFGKAGKLETLDDMKANDEAFTIAIGRLFAILSQWICSPNDTGAVLELISYSPSDILHRDLARAQRDLALMHTGQRDEIRARRYEHSFLRLTPLPVPPPSTKPKAFPVVELADGQGALPSVTNEDCRAACTAAMAIRHLDRAFLQLPQAQIVTELKIGNGYDRLVWPATSSYIASRLPMLHTIVAKLGEDKFSPDAQRRAREEYAQSMVRLPASLTKYQAQFISHQTAHPKEFDHPNLISSSPRDPLSRSIFTFSPHLKFLYLDNVTISFDLIFPSPSPNQPPTWPLLEIFWLHYRPALACGAVLFDCSFPKHTDDSSSDSDGEDPTTMNTMREFYAGWHVRASELDELYIRAAKTAKTMPRLQSMFLSARLSGSNTHRFEYNYHAATAKWMSTLTFEIGKGVREAWERLRPGIELLLDGERE